MDRSVAVAVKLVGAEIGHPPDDDDELVPLDDDDPVLQVRLKLRTKPDPQMM
jgi:hypothetical protein